MDDGQGVGRGSGALRGELWAQPSGLRSSLATTPELLWVHGPAVALTGGSGVELEMYAIGTASCAVCLVLASQNSWPRTRSAATWLLLPSWIVWGLICSAPFF